mgnify:CR=1 FL=1
MNYNKSVCVEVLSVKRCGVRRHARSETIFGIKNTERDYYDKKHDRLRKS